MRVLINQLDEHNEGNILATEKYNIDKVIFIIKEKENKILDNIINYYKENFKSVEFEITVIKEASRKELEELINENNNEDMIINLTGGSRINALILMEIASSKNIKAIYVDILNKKIYEFEESLKVIECKENNLDIKTIINSAGGEIIEDSTYLCENKNLIYLSNQIYKNLNTWNKYKQKLYDNNIFIHNTMNTNLIDINFEFLNTEEKNLLNMILEKLKEFNQINYKEENKNLFQVEFLTSYIKGFLFKSGTWLEVVTRNLINEIEEVTEVRNGIIFLWNNEDINIKNEIDVVAVKDSIPIFISCKDSEKYNEISLNELNVYSDKIGGKNAYKILVATKDPIKGTVKARANEMGISIVIFDGNEKKFTQDIKKAIGLL